MWLMSIGADAQQRAERGAEDVGVVGLLGARCGHLAELGRQRRGAVQEADTVRVALGQVRARAAEADVLQHPLHQFLGRLGGRQLVELLDLLAGEHQPRLELQQRRDQHEELRRGLQIELVERLEMVQVGDDDLGEIDLEQVELLPQDQREQQVKGTREDVEVQLQLGDAHAGKARWRLGRACRRPSLSRTSATTPDAFADAFAAPSSKISSIAAVSWTQFEVALARRAQPFRDLLADSGLEVAIALALEIVLDRGRRRPAHDREDLDHVR